MWGLQGGCSGEGRAPDNTAKKEVRNGERLCQLDLNLGRRNAQLMSHVAERLAGCQKATNLVGGKVEEQGRAYRDPLAKVFVARDQLESFTLASERQGKRAAAVKKNLRLIFADREPLLGAKGAKEVEQDLKADCKDGQQHDIISIQEDAEGEGHQVGAVATGVARGMLLQISGHAVEEGGEETGAHGAPLFNTLCDWKRGRAGGPHLDDSHRVTVK